MLQLVPLQLAVPFGSVLQAPQLGPQLARLLATQAPEQTWNPVGQVQTCVERSQVWLVLH